MVKPTRKQLERAIKMLTKYFMKHGRCSCDLLQCKERKTPSCVGKIKICEREHIKYFLSLAKAKGGKK